MHLLNTDKHNIKLVSASKLLYFSYNANLHSLGGINMNQSNLRVNGLPNIAAVWVNYFLR